MTGSPDVVEAILAMPERLSDAYIGICDTFLLLHEQDDHFLDRGCFALPCSGWNSIIAIRRLADRKEEREK